jgi:O-antigen/teichoic acid export membrane protein
LSQLKKGAFYSYLNLILTNIGGILVTPYIIRSLGNSEYGLYTLIGAFVGYLSILDLGLNNAIIRYVAQYKSQNDKKGQENFLATSLIIYAVIGVIIGCSGLVMYFNVENLFGNSLSIKELEKAKIMLLILVGNIAITLPGGAFIGICNGHEHFIFPRVLSIFKYVLRTILIIVILLNGADAIGIVILDTLMNLLFILAAIYYVFKVLKVKIKLHQFELPFIKEIFGYSIWIFVFGLVYQFQWRTGQIILGITTNTSTVAVYGVGVLLGVYFTNFGNVINGLILPKAVKTIYNKASPKILTREMVRISRVSLILLIYIYGAFLLFGQDFIYLWVGESYEASWFVAILIMTAYILPISQGYAHAILEAKKMMRFKALIFLVFSVTGITMGGVLSKSFGVDGMIYGLFTCLIVLQVVLTIFYHKRAGVDMWVYLKEALGPFLILLLFVVICSYWILQLFSVSWGQFVLKGISYSLIFVCGLLFVLTKEERKIILSKYISF